VVNTQVFGEVEQLCFGGFAITASAPDLLIVGIDRIANIIMEDKTYVGLIRKKL